MNNKNCEKKKKKRIKVDERISREKHNIKDGGNSCIRDERESREVSRMQPPPVVLKYNKVISCTRAAAAYSFSCQKRPTPQRNDNKINMMLFHQQIEKKKKSPETFFISIFYFMHVEGCKILKNLRSPHTPSTGAIFRVFRNRICKFACTKMLKREC